MGNHFEIIAESEHLRLVRLDGWEFAERIRISGIVCIVALTSDQRLLLGEQRSLGKAIDVKVYAGLYVARTLSQ